MATIKTALQTELKSVGATFAIQKIKLSDAFTSIKKLDTNDQPTAVQFIFDGLNDHFNGLIDGVKTAKGKKAAEQIGELMEQSKAAEAALWVALRQYTSKHVVDGKTLQRKKGVVQWIEQPSNTGDKNGKKAVDEKPQQIDRDQAITALKSVGVVDKITALIQLSSTLNAEQLAEAITQLNGMLDAKQASSIKKAGRKLAKAANA